MTHKRKKPSAAQSPPAAMALHPPATRPPAAPIVVSAPPPALWDSKGRTRPSALLCANLFVLGLALAAALYVSSFKPTAQPPPLRAMSTDAVEFMLYKDTPCCYEEDEFEVRRLAHSLLGPIMQRNDASPAVIEDYPRPAPGKATPVTVMSRGDGEPFHLEFNTEMDRAALNKPEYDHDGRVHYVTGMQKTSATTLARFKGAANTVGCGNGNVDSSDAFVVAVCAMSPFVSFQWRFSYGHTVILVHAGEAVVMVTRPERADSLVLFPALHPLKGQSQLSSKRFSGHQVFTSDPYDAGHRIPANNITLHAGDALYIPPLWGHRLVATHAVQNTVVQLDYAKASRPLTTLGEALQALPKALRPGALRQLPLWVSLWNLEMFMDELFGFRDRDDRHKAKLLEVVKWRWLSRVIRGCASARLTHALTANGRHVDDPRDEQTGKAPVLELQAQVRRVCGEMAARGGDPSVSLPDRHLYVDDAVAAAAAVNALLGALQAPEAALNELRLDLLERAVADTIAVPALAPFFECAFAL